MVHSAVGINKEIMEWLNKEQSEMESETAHPFMEC